MAASEIDFFPGERGEAFEAERRFDGLEALAHQLHVLRRRRGLSVRPVLAAWSEDEAPFGAWAVWATGPAGGADELLGVVRAAEGVTFETISAALHATRAPAKAA